MPAYNIDLTLDSLKIPNINGTFPFGTKITPTELNKGGLSTAEVNSNIMMPFMQMRPKVCTADSTTSQVEYDAKVVFNAPQGVTPSEGYTLTMGDGTYIGCTVTFTNLMEYACTVKQSDGMTTLFSVPAGKTMSAMWTGTAWRWTTTGSVTADDPTPVSSAAVHAAIDNLNLVPAQSNPSYNALKSSAGWTASQACILCGNIQPNAGNSIVSWYVNGEKVSHGGTNDAPYNSSVCFPVPKNGKVTVDGDSINNNFFCLVFYFTH